MLDSNKLYVAMLPINISNSSFLAHGSNESKVKYFSSRDKAISFIEDLFNENYDSDYIFSFIKTKVSNRMQQCGESTSFELDSFSDFSFKVKRSSDEESAKITIITTPIIKTKLKDGNYSEPFTINKLYIYSFVYSEYVCIDPEVSDFDKVSEAM